MAGFAGDLCQRGTDEDFNDRLGIRAAMSSQRLWEGYMESDARYYRRRAVEERMAAQRAMTEQARAWHAKLASDFAHRADNSGTLVQV
jgi:hypothetical protein